MAELNPGTRWPVHPRERFSDTELGIGEADAGLYDKLTEDELRNLNSIATQRLLHGSPLGLERIAAIDTLHVLASKMGFELVPVERQNG